MPNFWGLMKESVIVQGLLTLGVTGGVLAMSFMRYPVEREWWTLLGIAWGFYFGSKIQMSIEGYKRK